MRIQNKFSKWISASFALALCQSAQAAVWQVQEKWTPEWENKYAEWVRTSWDKDFFSRPGTAYTGLKLDCADTVYSMRIVFAYEHKLPFAMKDPSGGKKLITNDMSRWDHLSNPDQRIRNFLTFVYGTASTHSIPSDTYPTKINRDAVRSGSLILTDKQSHHSWTIKEVLPSGIPHLIFNSRPAATNLQFRVYQPSMEFTFKNRLDVSLHAGFRNFRRIEDLDKPVWQVEGYSDEQYRLPYDKWRSIVQKKLAITEEKPEAQLQRMIETACTEARARVNSVNEGLVFLSKMSASACMNATDYDNYSTPNRDMRVRNAFEDLQEAYREIDPKSLAHAKLPNGDSLIEKVEDVISDTTQAASLPSEQRYCSVEVAPGKFLSLGEVRQRSLGGALSHNPHDDFDARWGYRKTPTSRAQRCPKYE